MVTSTMLYSLAIVGLAAAGFWFARRLPRRWLVWPAVGLAAVVFVLASTVFAWSVARAAGDRSRRALDLGSSLIYERTAVDEPQRQVLHVAVVDLDNPCIDLVTTRPGPGGAVQAETATEFVDRTGVTLSINVAFYRGFNEYPPWSATKSGDEVHAIGPVVIDGNWLGDVAGGGNLGLALTNGVLSAAEIPDDADFAVRGRSALVANGLVVPQDSVANARAAAGVDLDTNRLILLVADGKQPGYAVGSTYEQMAEYLILLGADEAVEFDGGGSATMAAMVDGQVELLSRPSHQQIPGRQRPVATHLGVVVDPDCPT